MSGARLDMDGLKVLLDGLSKKTSVLTKALTSSQNVGGVVVGQSWDKDTKIEKVLKDILDPLMFPQLVNPSATVTTSGGKLLEKGMVLATSLTVEFSRGEIDPAYGTEGYRSGIATGYALNGGSVQAENEFEITVDEQHTTYTATVAYEVGEQPKDSEGNDYDEPLPAGTVNSKPFVFEYTYATYANTSNIATMTKQSLVSNASPVKQFDFPATTEANPETFDIPSAWRVTSIEVYNALSGKWESTSGQFTASNTTHEDAGGNTVQYKRYTCNLGYDLGDRAVRVRWTV